MKKLKESLKKVLTKSQLNLVPSSFDVVGDIAIFHDFPKELTKKQTLIAKTLLKLQKNIKTVVKKTKQFSGKYRLQKVKILLEKDGQQQLTDFELSHDNRALGDNL